MTLTLRPEITGRASGDLEPLGVSPRQAGHLLNIGQTRVWVLIGSGELESYKEGRSRKITMRSIRARHERQLAAAHGATEIAQPRPRGRPRKLLSSEVMR
jgi:hypothetical protein